MRRMVLAYLAALAVGLFVVAANVAGPAAIVAPAQASAYGLPKYTSDTTGWGTLELWWQDQTDGTGMDLTTLQISDTGGLNNGGLAGIEIKCWNQNNVVVWSKGADAASVGKNDSKSWSPGVFGGATEMHCRWDYQEKWLVGGPGPTEYAKVNAY